MSFKNIKAKINKKGWAKYQSNLRKNSTYIQKNLVIKNEINENRLEW